MRRAFIGMTIVAAMAAVAAAPAGAGSTSASDVAEAGTIVAGDLGPGWTSSPSDDGADKQLEKQAKKVKGCDDYVAVRKAMDKATDAASPDFQSSAEQIGNHVYVFDKESEATKVVKQAKAKGMADCFTDLFTKVIGQEYRSNKQVKSFRVKIKDVPSLEDGLGDQSVAYSGGLEVNGTDGSQEQLVLSTLLVQVGPAVLTYTYSFLPTQSTSSAFDTALENTIVRTQDALG